MLFSFRLAPLWVVSDGEERKRGGGVELVVATPITPGGEEVEELRREKEEGLG